MFLLINHKLIRKEKKYCTELQYRPHTEYDFVLDVVFPIAPECLEYCTNTTICKQKSIRIRAKQLQTLVFERNMKEVSSNLLERSCVPVTDTTSVIHTFSMK